MPPEFLTMNDLFNKIIKIMNNYEAKGIKQQPAHRLKMNFFFFVSVSKPEISC